MLLQKIAKESTEKSELEEDNNEQYYCEEVAEKPEYLKDINMFRI